VEQALRRGLDALGLSLAETQVAQLMEFAGLLQKWGRVYNLTALRSPEEVITHHLLDCLAILAPLVARLRGMPGSVLDVGSGAGLPGVVLAIAHPETQVDCVDAVAKKAAFVQQAAAMLRLSNLRGLHGRVQDCAQRHPLVTSRAFASLANFTAWSDAALAEGGIWLAMKGKVPTEEMAALPSGVEVFHVEHLRVPGLDAERCLVWMRRRGA
jgi:16S rRNA (guanine527-N7)-methyltransferase